MREREKIEEKEKKKPVSRDISSILISMIKRMNVAQNHLLNFEQISSNFLLK